MSQLLYTGSIERASSSSLSVALIARSFLPGDNDGDRWKWNNSAAAASNAPMTLPSTFNKAPEFVRRLSFSPVRRS